MSKTSASAACSAASSSTVASSSSSAATQSRYLLGSADLMPRNLDHRIEVVTPVEARPLQAKLDAMFDALLADNAQAWELRPDGSWVRVQPPEPKQRRTAQGELMRKARSSARRLARASD